MRLLSLLVISLLLLTSCNQKQKQGYQTPTAVESTSNKQHSSKRLMEQQCYLCHNPKTNQGARIAPPMVAIK